MSRAEDEFYVGYLPESPPRQAGFTRGRALLLAAVCVLAAVLAAAAHRRLPDKVFEFGVERRLTGWIDEAPYPTLVVERPGQVAGRAGTSRYLLVAFGKHGASEAVRGLDGKRVRVTGSLIYREDQTMVELAEGGVEVLEGPEAPSRPAEAVRELGRMTLRGEIVDSKCYLGVMAPGSAKPHKACAVRCISGGIPPVLMVRDEKGQAVYLLLARGDGTTIGAEILDLVAETVEITGQVERHDDLLVLKADPRDYRRVE